MQFVMSASHEQAEFEGNLKMVKDLKTALRTQPLRYVKATVQLQLRLWQSTTYSFVLHFIDLNGLEHLFDFLRRMNNEIR